MLMEIKAPAIWEPLFRKELVHFREILAYGGRGSGKTNNIAGFLCLEFLAGEGNILCLREFKNSTGDSVKSEFDDFFQKYGLDDLGVQDGEIIINDPKRKHKLISIKTTTITNHYNKNKIIFAGITPKTIYALKSLKNIKYVWIDEADFLGEREYNILKPTIRMEGSQIILTFNPQNEDDFVYQLAKTKSPRRFAMKVNYTDNPYFPKVLNDDRLEDLETKPAHLYDHIWNGVPLRDLEGVIFSDETIKKMIDAPRFFDRDDGFDRVCIACDPATTSKDYSNEFGICVLGFKDGIVYLLEDLSRNCTPDEFAEIVNNGYQDWQCDCCVVETNQGGDFIKSTLIAKNPFLEIVEVRAVKDKVNRATPIANLASMGKIKFGCEDYHKIVRQMKRLTNKGYAGIKGESPDRLDAFVWGCFHLLNLSDAGTQGKVFTEAMLSYNDFGLLFRSSVGVLYIEGGEFGLIVGDLFKTLGKIEFKAKYAIKGDTTKFYELTQEVSCSELYCNDVSFGRTLKMNGLKKKGFLKNANASEIALASVSTISNKVNAIDCFESSYLGTVKNWLLFDLVKYQTEEKNTETPLVSAFCALLNLIK